MTTIDKLEQIRKRHHISREEMIDGIVAPSTFSRFVNNKSIIRADLFLDILEKLEPSFFEVTTFSITHYEVNDYKQKVAEALRLKDDNLLRTLQADIRSKIIYPLDSYDFLNLEIERYFSDQVPECLLEYFSNYENINHTLMYLYCHYIDHFSTEVIENFAFQCIRKFPNDLNAETKMNLIILLHHVNLTFMKRKELRKTQRILQHMKVYMEPVGFTMQKYYYTVDKCLFNCAMNQNSNSFKKYFRMIKNFYLLECDVQADRMIIYYEELGTIYHFPPLPIF